MSAPLVSILTPAYNAARFIEETIKSVSNQTFGDFELLVVDDGSTDDTLTIVQAYTQQDPRIRLSCQGNAGIAAARNAALARARGRFVTLLDSDDLWYPTYLSEQLEILTRSSDIAVLSANAINFGGVFDGEPLLPLPEHSGIQRVSLIGLVEAEDSMSILSIIRREVFDTIGAFDVSMRRSEDYDFWLRAAAAGFRIAVNPKPLGRYRRRPDSLSADEALMLEAMMTPLVKLRKLCPEQSDVQVAVNHQLARLARRALVARAKYALLQGDMAAVSVRFAALADATGAARYRIASWLSGRAPATIRWAYECKKTLAQLSKPRRRSSEGQRHRSRRLDQKPIGSTTC